VSERLDLGKGTVGFVESSPVVPLVSIVLAWRSGATADPRGKDGICRFATRMPRPGIGGMNSPEVEAPNDTPGGGMGAEHFYPRQEQQIHVIEGELMCRIEGVEFTLRAGESAVVPAGVTHFQANRTDRSARAIEEHRPAGMAHNFFRVAFALARDGRTNAVGVPKPLIGAALMLEFNEFVQPTSPWLRVLFSMLGPLSSILGYRRVIRQYVQSCENEDVQRSRLMDKYVFSAEMQSKELSQSKPA